MLLCPRMAIFSGEERGRWIKITEVQPRDFRTLWGLQNGLDSHLSQMLWLLPHSRERQVPFGCDSRTMHTKGGLDVLTLALVLLPAVLIRVFSEGWVPDGEKALSILCSSSFHSFIH